MNHTGITTTTTTTIATVKKVYFLVYIIQHIYYLAHESIISYTSPSMLLVVWCYNIQDKKAFILTANNQDYVTIVG